MNFLQYFPVRWRAWRAGVLAVLLPLALAPITRAQRNATTAAHGVVVSASRIASEVGVDVLRRGGNAVDAAVATAFCLAVTYPEAGNIGGGGFMLIRLANGTAVLLDYRETAPALANPGRYLDASGKPIAGLTTRGHLAAGVPGTVAGLETAYRTYGSGKIAWAELVERAHLLARDGFPVSTALADGLREHEKLFAGAAARKIFLRDGAHYQPGDVLVQPELAATLERIMKTGATDFYKGETARRIVADMRRAGGLITAQDLEGYSVVKREPLVGKYRGLDVLTTPPPSTGGIALLQMLTMLEPQDVGALGSNSAAKIHLFTEVMRRAFRDRAEYLGDPAYVQIPVPQLLSPPHIKNLMASFKADAATRSEELHADPDVPRTGSSATEKSPSKEAMNTTHFAIADADGNVVSNTFTLNGRYGSGVVVEGAGFLLNNEMDDFTLNPTVRNRFGLLQGESNLVAGGRRPASSMTPTIVLKDGRPYIVTGSPGGPTIITTVLQVITNVVDHEMSITQAVDASRFHHQWSPDVLYCEPYISSPDTLALIKKMGHAYRYRPTGASTPAKAEYWGDAASILIAAGGVKHGANDPRNADAYAAGY